MNTSRRTFLTAALGAAGVAAATAACGPTAGGDDPTTSGGGEATASGPPSGKLLVWDFGNETLKDYEDPIFQAEFPDVELTHVTHPAANYETLLQTAITSPSGPDVVVLGGGITVGRFAAALQPLDDMLTDDQSEYMFGWDSMRAESNPDNPILGLPSKVQSWIFYYNRDLYEQAGLDPDQPPASIDELMDACDALKAAGITPFSVGDGEAAQAAVWFESLEGSFLDADQARAVALGEMPWSSPEVTAVFQTYLDLANEGNFQPSWRTDGAFTQQPDLFSSGQVAMTMHLTSYAGIFETALGIGRVGIFSNPAAETGGSRKYVLCAPANAICVAKRTTNMDAAFAWASWKVSRESQERDLIALSGANEHQNGRLPTRTDVEIPEDASPLVAKMAETFATEPIGVSSLSLGIAPPEVNTEISQTFGSVLDGDLPLADFLARLDEIQQG